MHYRFWFACGAGGEHHGQIMLVIHIHDGLGNVIRRSNGLIVDHILRNIPADADIFFNRGQILPDGLNHREKFRPQEEDLGIAHLSGIKDIRTHKPEIQRHNHGANLDDSVIGDKPFQGIVLEVHYIVAVFDPQFL